MEIDKILNREELIKAVPYKKEALIRRLLALERAINLLKSFRKNLIVRLRTIYNE